MSTHLRFAAIRGLVMLISLCLAAASSCSPASKPTPFIPPTAQAPLIEPTLIIQPTETVPDQKTPLPTIVIPTLTSTPEDCVSNLTFLSDLTVFDGTSITYGASIDKQWLVQNSGTCNWNVGYRLRYIGGAILGAPEELNLYPAKSGTQAVIQITFTAPFADGQYESAWQAFDPAGLAFGDAIYMRIVVVPP